MKHIEIERKWLLDAFPSCIPLIREERVEQGYLTFDPVTVRIRKTEELAPNAGRTRHVLTIKGGGTLKRTEVEPRLAADEYEALLSLLPMPVVRKHFRLYQLPDGHQLECSLVDEGEPTSFLYAEVEFDTEEQALAFQPPAFLGRELTGDGSWTMAAYCRRKYADANKKECL